MKIKVEKEMSLGELLHEILSERGCRVLSSDCYDKPMEVGSGGLEPIAEEFYEAVRSALLREGNKR